MEFVDGYIDLQVNGYRGVDFNDPHLQPSQIAAAARAMREDGVQAALATVITGSLDGMCACISNLRKAIEADAAVAAVLAGIHLEGPFLSPLPGFIGAHPKQHALACEPRAMERLLDAAGPWTKIVTLAPEIDLHGELTRQCVERGALVAAGHTDASLEQLERCVSAGLSLFTHLGNGCPNLLNRHDNIVYRGLRLFDRLHYSLIADGFHIPKMLFENLLHWLPLERILVVSDAIAAAGLGPGLFRLGERQVNIGMDRAARDVSGQHFVGSASTMRDADGWLAEQLQLSLQVRQQILRDNARRLLGG